MNLKDPPFTHTGDNTCFSPKTICRFVGITSLSNYGYDFNTDFTSFKRFQSHRLCCSPPGHPLPIAD